MIIKQWCKMIYKDTFIVYKFIVDSSINSLTVSLHELMLLWYVRTAFFAALRTLSLGLNSKQALSWFCFAHIKQQIVSLFRSDLILVCIFFNIETILSGSALLTGITQQALANLDKTLKLSLSVNGSLWSAISPQKVSIPDKVAE